MLILMSVIGVTVVYLMLLTIIPDVDNDNEY